GLGRSRPISSDRSRCVERGGVADDLATHRDSGGSVIPEQTREIVERRRPVAIVIRRSVAGAKQADDAVHLIEAVTADALGVDRATSASSGFRRSRWRARRELTDDRQGRRAFARQAQHPAPHWIIELRSRPYPVT